MVDERRDRVRVIPHGIDLERFRPDPNVVDPLPAVAHPRIIFVGRLRHYKGLPILAAALEQLPQAQLVVVGGGPERGRFEAALRARGCRTRAHLVGEVDDDQLIRLLQTADAAVLPSTSRAEAFGLAIAEAQACGVPAVTTAVGTGTSQTVADGVSGRVIRPGDAAELAEALTWCLDPLQQQARRAAARAHAETALCARRMTEAIHAVYDEVRNRAHLS
jgi:rhamnosyl/mannosyltransferase